jgi:hypothetical protein
MIFQDPLIPSNIENLYYLAPIPVYLKYFEDDDLADYVYQLGLNQLTDKQKQMGQELPEQYDSERQSTYDINYERKDQWVEMTEFQPIGSRFSVPPNNFLDTQDDKVYEIKQRVKNGFVQIMNDLTLKHNNNPIITESWMQYYEPTLGRGHNQHNHCRWSSYEEPKVGFAGGYYLNDGEPIADHPYSGVFTFHIRGYTYHIRPKKGMLILWPYDIVHSVKPFYGKTNRCVINFNIQDGI